MLDLAEAWIHRKGATVCHGTDRGHGTDRWHELGGDRRHTTSRDTDKQSNITARRVRLRAL